MRRAKESSTPNPGVTALVRGDSWCERLKRVIGEVPEWLNGAVSKTVVDLVSTVGSNPTLSAERKVLWAYRLSICWKTDVKERDFTPWCDLHTRDRSVTAGRSQLLSGPASVANC